MKYFNELHKNIITNILKKIVDIYKDNLVSLIIFGSYARNNPRLNSDLDILIILKQGKKRTELNDFFYEKIEKEFEKDLLNLYENYGINIDLSPFIISKENSSYFNPLYLDMAEQSEIILDENNYFSEILKRIKKIKKQYNIKKLNYGNRYFWDFSNRNLIGEKI